MRATRATQGNHEEHDLTSARASRKAAIRILVAAGLAVAATVAVIAAQPASASTVNGVATIASPGTTTLLLSGGSTTPFTVSLPPQAACDGDTATDGYHVYSYLVPQGTDLSSVTFIGHPSVGVGLVNSDGAYYGPVNTAIGTGQIPTLPNDFEWGPLVTVPRMTLSQLLYTGSGESGIWEAGIACATSSGALADNWNTEVTFDASSTDTNGFTWSAVPGPSGSAFAAFTSATSTTFTEGSSGSFTPTASGTPAPTITENGTLPIGVTFSGGVLSGTPTASGPFPVTVTATNGIGSPATQSFTLVVDAGPTITSPDSLTAATGGPITPFQVTADGYPAPTFGSTGNLDGLTLDPNSGQLTGTPTVDGDFPITVTATNGVGSPATQPFTLDVDDAPTITSPDTVRVDTGGSITPFQVVATGNPAPTFSSTGNLDGLILDPNSGELSGTPTAGGEFPIALTATNGVGSPATQSFTLVVLEAPLIRSYAGTTFVAGTSGTYTVKTSGFPRPIVTEKGTLPTGVTLERATGVLSGTATSIGRFPVVLTAHNSVGTPVTQSFTLWVEKIKITTLVLPPATRGTPYTKTLAELGGTAPFTWAISGGSLPSGLAFATSTGTISGSAETTDAAGSYAITVTVTDQQHLKANRALNLVLH